MTATTFWSADGHPMPAAQFLESQFGKLHEFFKDADQLRALWSDPETRKASLSGLADKGFGREPLAEMQKRLTPPTAICLACWRTWRLLRPRCPARRGRMRRGRARNAQALAPKPDEPEPNK